VTLSSLARPIDLDDLRRRLDAGGGNDRKPIGLGSLTVGPNALDELPAIVDRLAGDRLAGDGEVVVLVDQTPMRRGDADLKPGVVKRLAPRAIRLVALGAGLPELHADASAINEATDAGRGATVVVGLGSGTICDIGKEASRAIGASYVAVQTAASVNAFSDDMAVLLVNGVKRTIPSRWPDALVIDLSIVADAPPALNRSGVGELASTFTAPADWYLAAATGMDASYDDQVVGLFRDRSSALLAAAPGIGRAEPDPDAIAVLCEVMTLSGLAMGVAGRTAPVSGTEHTVSHLLDMDAAATGRRTGLHGAQVGVAAVAVAVAWEHVLDRLDPEQLLRDRDPDRTVLRARVATAFGDLDPSGAMAAECWRELKAKMDRWQALGQVLRQFVADWDRHRQEIRAPLADPRAIATALRDAGAPATFGELDPPISLATATWALHNGHLLRDRFSLADLAWLGGLWTEDVAAGAIEEAAAIVGRL
jgi:glycerol-1-phosphate dehydrogenase [NAD(P)+]